MTRAFNFQTSYSNYIHPVTHEQGVQHVETVMLYHSAKGALSKPRLFEKPISMEAALQRLTWRHYEQAPMRGRARGRFPFAHAHA